MADTDQDQKTEQPTGKHLSEAIERGQFAKAPEIQVLCTLAAVLGVLAFTARTAWERVAEYAVGIFSGFTALTLRQDTVVSHLVNVVAAVAPVVLPVLGACAGAAMLAGGLQSGFKLTPKAVGFNLEKLNPAAGFGRIFSKSAFPRTGLDLLKVLTIGFALYLGAKQLLVDPLFSAPVEAAYLVQFLHQASITFFSRLLFSLGLVAALSYGYEFYKNKQEMRMTRQEVKEELHSTEVDAKLKAALRRMGRRLLQKQMLSAVPTADVIVTNPTHYAVALKYERGKDQAPVVLAKGENRFAQRIKALALEHGVPMVENKPVARVLFSMGRVGEAVPPELYQAVAEILALVYRTHRYYFHRLRSRRLEPAV